MEPYYWTVLRGFEEVSITTMHTERLTRWVIPAENLRLTPTNSPACTYKVKMMQATHKNWHSSKILLPGAHVHKCYKSHNVQLSSHKSNLKTEITNTPSRPSQTLLSLKTPGFFVISNIPHCFLGVRGELYPCDWEALSVTVYHGGSVGFEAERLLAGKA